MFCAGGAQHSQINRRKHIFNRMYFEAHNTVYTKYNVWKMLCPVQTLYNRINMIFIKNFKEKKLVKYDNNSKRN